MNKEMLWCVIQRQAECINSLNKAIMRLLTTSAELKELEDISSTKNEVKPIILDDNEYSLSKYAEEFPENWKAISNAKLNKNAPKKDL